MLDITCMSEVTIKTELCDQLFSSVVARSKAVLQIAIEARLVSGPMGQLEKQCPIKMVSALERAECGHGDEVAARDVVSFSKVLTYVRTCRAQELVGQGVARVGIANAHRLTRRFGKTLALVDVEHGVFTHHRDKPPFSRFVCAFADFKIFDEVSRSRNSAQGDKWSFCLTAGTLVPANQERPMSRRSRRTHSPAFKAKVALATVKGDRTIAQLAEHFDVHPNQITAWKSQLEASASEIFGRGVGTPATPAVDVKSLHAKIGELTLENDFLEGALTKAGLLSAKR